MKLPYSKITYYILSLFMVITFVSCGTMQTFSDSNDGIYDDLEQTEKSQRKIIVVNEQEYNDYEENYFTKEIERLDLLNGTNIFTDIENYSSEDTNFNEDEEIIDEAENRINYNTNQPWGYNDNNSDVVININASPRSGFYNDLYWFNTYGYRPWWRSRNFNNWYPYDDYYYYNSGFHNPYFPYYGISYYNNYRPYRYYNNRYYRPRRGANYNRGYRKSAYSRRSLANYSSSRRSSNVYRKSRGVTNKGRNKNIIRSKRKSKNSSNSRYNKSYNPNRNRSSRNSNNSKKRNYSSNKRSNSSFSSRGRNSSNRSSSNRSSSNSRRSKRGRR